MNMARLRQYYVNANRGLVEARLRFTGPKGKLRSLRRGVSYGGEGLPWRALGVPAKLQAAGSVPVPSSAGRGRSSARPRRPLCLPISVVGGRLSLSGIAFGAG